jgi:precorrin-6B methylase 2
MRGSIPVKIGRLVADLARHPQYLPRAFRHNLINGAIPLDLQLPWFSYAAIDFLERELKPEMNVCEYGSGGSTLFFARRVRSVVSIENDSRWFQMVTDRVKKFELHNVEVKLCPFDFKNPVGFDKSEYLHAIPKKTFDLIVIDGTEEWHQVRPICFEHAEKFIKPGGMIVVDDSWRYPSLRQNHHAKANKIFQSVGPCRPGVTSTDIFFY